MTVRSCVVQIDTQVGPVGRLVVGVQPGQHVAVGAQLPAAERALLGGDVAGQVGERRAVVRRAERDDPAGDVGAAVGDPQPGHDAAGRVADDVDALRAGAVQRRVRRVGERVGRLGEVAGAVAGQLARPWRRGRRRSAGRRASAATPSTRRSPGTSSTGPGRSWDTGSAAGAVARDTRTTTSAATATTTRAATPSTSRRRAGESPASTPLLSLGKASGGTKEAGGAC